MRRVRLWLDEPSLGGSGERSFLIVREGRKVATLLYVPYLQAISVPTSRLAKAEVEVIEGAAARRKLAATIRETERERKRFAKRYSGAVVKDALAQLKKETA